MKDLDYCRRVTIGRCGHPSYTANGFDILSHDTFLPGFSWQLEPSESTINQRGIDKIHVGAYKHANLRIYWSLPYLFHHEREKKNCAEACLMESNVWLRDRYLCRIGRRVSNWRCSHPSTGLEFHHHPIDSRQSVDTRWTPCCIWPPILLSTRYKVLNA